MVTKRDYAFVQVIGGIVFIFVPILAIYNLSPEQTFDRDILMAFALFGTVTGFLAGTMILKGYYRLTERLKDEW